MVRAKMGKHIRRDDLKHYEVYSIESEINNRINYITDFNEFLIFRSEDNPRDHTHGEIIRGDLEEMPLAIKYMKSTKEKLELVEVYEELTEIRRLGGMERWNHVRRG